MTRNSALTSRRRTFGLARWVAVALTLCVLGMVSGRTLAQGQPGGGTNPSGTPSTAAPAPAAGGTGNAQAPEQPKVTLVQLFWESKDFFTLLLVVGSLAGWTIIIVCLIEIRRTNIVPAEPEQIISGLCKSGRWADLRQFVSEDDAFVSKVLRAAMNTPVDDKNAMREAAEMVASEESARWFRKIEPLNVIGNLGPLLGLAGTVWGMIIAFAALGQSGGQANPATLSLGISKALFHTLLGLLLAVPCLTVFGFYRSIVDRLCTRAMVAAADFVELLPAGTRERMAGGVSGGNGAPPPPRASPAQMPTPQPRPTPR